MIPVDAFWGVILIAAIVITGGTVVAALMLALSLWVVDTLLSAIERLEPPEDDD